MTFKEATLDVFSGWEHAWDRGWRPAILPATGDILLMSEFGSYVRAVRGEHRTPAFDYLLSVLTDCNAYVCKDSMRGGQWCRPADVVLRDAAEQLSRRG